MCNDKFECKVSKEPLEADFSWALRWLKDGHKVARKGWNGKDQWVAMQKVDNNPALDLPYFYLHNAQGLLCMWVPSNGDLLATDWVIVKSE